MKNVLNGLRLAACGFLLIASADIGAAVTVTIQQSGSDVVATSSGTINTGVCSATSNTTSNGSGISPSGKILSFGAIGSGQTSCTTTINAPAAFGSGAWTGSSSATGASFYLYPTGFWGPLNFTSSTSFEGILTFNSTTIAGMGLTAGTYVFTLSNGATSDTVTVQVNSTPASLSWVIENTPNAYYEDIAFGGGTLVTAGPAPAASSPDNGVNWPHVQATSAWVSGVGYGAGIFVVAGPNILTTTSDGVTWNVGSTGTWPNWYPRFTYGGGQFVAVGNWLGSGSYIRTSANGTTWTDQVSPITGKLTAVTYGSGTYVAVTSANVPQQVITSTDGITWTAQTVNIGSSEWTGIAYGGGLFVAVSHSGLIMTSPDAMPGHWTQRTAPATRQWSAITYGGGTFVAVSNDGTGATMSSNDGINWTIVTAPILRSWESVTYGGGYFYAVGYGLGLTQIVRGTMAVPVAAAPTSTTGAATSITTTGATLNGTVSSNGASTTVTFEYGLTNGYGSTATAAQSPLSSSASSAGVSTAITGLTCNTLYHFRVNANNGTGGTINGSDATFTTSVCPTYSIGGTISSLTTSGLVLTDTNAGSSTITSGATTFTLPTALNSSAGYAVSVQTQPTGQTCSLSNASGTVASSNVTNVTVTCTTPPPPAPPPPPPVPPAPTPDAPPLTPAGGETSPGTPLSGSLAPSSVTGTLFYQTTAATHGTSTVATNGTYTYTPNPGYEGLDIIGYVGCSGGACGMTSSATCTGALCSPGTLYIGVAQANRNASNQTASTGSQQNITNVLNNVTWSGQPASSPQFKRAIYVLSNEGVPAPTPSVRTAFASTQNPISVNTTTGEITVAPNAARGTYTVKTLLCLTAANQSSLEKLLDVLSIKAAFADGTTDVTLHGAAPCVNQTTNILVDSTLIAQDDTFNTWINQAVSASVDKNDTYPSGSTFSVLSEVTNGKLTFNTDGSFKYKPKNNFKGSDAFKYGLCEAAPKSNICTSANVTLNVGTVKLTQRPLVLTASSATTSMNAAVRLNAKGGSVNAVPVFTVVSSTGANCKITGSGSTRDLKITGLSGATCSVTATKQGNKRYEPVTSNPVTVTLQ